MRQAHFYERDPDSLPVVDLQLKASPDLSLREAITHFLLMARVDGRSYKTLELYSYVFNSFIKFLGDPSLSLSEINTLKIRSYLASLQDRGLCKTTSRIHLVVLKTFFNWLAQEQLLSKNPIDLLKTPKLPKQFPFILSDPQVATLLKACDQHSWRGFRDYTMLLCFIDVGLRLNELISLQLQDVSLAQRSLKVQGKGSKERLCFMGARLTKAMRRWLDLRGFKPYSEEVFIARTGERLKPRYVQHIVANLGKKASITGVRVSPHTLRHTAATLAVRNGLDVFSLQRLFGWGKVETAMRYVHMSGRALQEAFIRASPVDRLLGA